MYKSRRIINHQSGFFWLRNHTNYCTPTRLCPDSFVPIRNCALTWLCPDTNMTIYIIYILLIITSAIIILHIFNRKFKNTKYFSKNAAGDSCTVVKKTFHFASQLLSMFLFTPFKLTHTLVETIIILIIAHVCMVGTVMYGHNRGWTQLCMGTIESEHNLVGTNVVEPFGCNFHHKYLISISYNYDRYPIWLDILRGFIIPSIYFVFSI